MSKELKLYVDVKDECFLFEREGQCVSAPRGEVLRVLDEFARLFGLGLVRLAPPAQENHEQIVPSEEVEEVQKPNNPIIEETESQPLDEQEDSEDAEEIENIMPEPKKSVAKQIAEKLETKNTLKVQPMKRLRA